MPKKRVWLACSEKYLCSFLAGGSVQSTTEVSLSCLTCRRNKQRVVGTVANWKIDK